MASKAPKVDPQYKNPFPGETPVEKHAVIIIGAGPTGLFTALKLAHAGIDVLILESESGVLQSPRATTYMPIVLNEFDKVGLYEDVLAAGYINTQGVTWRTPAGGSNKTLATLSLSLVPKGTNKYEFAGIHMGQHKLAEVMLNFAKQFPSFSIKFGQRYVGQSQTGDAVQVATVTAQGEKFYECQYLVGADGAGSSVRRSLCIPFEGFTWQDFRFMATNVIYDFAEHGYTTANMIVDDEDWAVIARTGKPEENIWRVAYGIRTDIPEADLLKSLPEKYEKLLPGPRPLKYKLLTANPYWAHQRVAREYKVGRIVLCGDASHSNNPIGGLGLTTGLMDATALANCLIRILKKGEADPDALLTRYAAVRRHAWVEYSNKQSIEFKLRLHDPAFAQAREEFFHNLNTDPKFTLMLAGKMNEVVDDTFED